MITNKFVQFLDGTASEYDKQEIIYFLIDNPGFIDVFRGLLNVKGALPAGISLMDHLEEQKTKIGKIINAKLKSS